MLRKRYQSFSRYKTRRLRHGSSWCGNYSEQSGPHRQITWIQVQKDLTEHNEITKKIKINEKQTIELSRFLDWIIRFFVPWLGDGLLVSTGSKWKSHRKIIAPTFHLNVLKTFVPLFYQNSIDLVQRLSSEVGKEFDCHNYLSAVTVDILLETAMGVRGRKDKTGFEYAMAVMKWEQQNSSNKKFT